MKNYKYYTPALEDLFIGYECEQYEPANTENDGEIIRVEHADQNMDDVSAEYMDDDGDQILSVQLRQVKYIFNIKATGAIRVMQAGR